MENVIVGTIRAKEYSRYHPNDQFAYCQWDVLKLFERIFLDSKLSGMEESRLQAAVSDPKIRQRIMRAGIGEYVGAAELIEEALRLGPSVNPIGYALIQGAADWRCAGLRAPVPESLLPALAEPHLTARNRLELSNNQAYKAALQWATRDINPSVALLQRDGPESFSIFDYALDILSQGDDRIPDATWQMLIENAEPDDLISVGYTAEVIYGKSDVALQAWQTAADSGHADHASMATCNIMTYHQNHGNENAAEAAC